MGYIYMGKEIRRKQPSQNSSVKPSFYTVNTVGERLLSQPQKRRQIQ
jgi:hypothetical protein